MTQHDLLRVSVAEETMAELRAVTESYRPSDPRWCRCANAPTGCSIRSSTRSRVSAFPSVSRWDCGTCCPTIPTSPPLRSRRQHHPAVVAAEAHRAANVQLRIADAITGFAGSMRFVYIHAVVFVLWMLFVESDPWPKLTLVVSLEAIFLSTFVMIGQNRAAAFQQAKADHDFIEQETELKTNTQLTREIHALTTELHRRAFDGG